MTKFEEYRRKLQTLENWAPYLRRESGVPGPRGNLELAQAVADLATPHEAEAMLAGPDSASPENSPGVFVLFCGITSLGKLIARGDRTRMARLRSYAADSRWRVREAVAIALQYIGDADMTYLLAQMRTWAKGNWYEKRAVAAALAEPRLLSSPREVASVLKILDSIMSEIKSANEPLDGSFRACRQTMGYAWSVVVAAAPSLGRARMEKWFKSRQPNVRWVMKENLKKARLARMAPAWIARWRARLVA